MTHVRPFAAVVAFFVTVAPLAAQRLEPRLAAQEPDSGGVTVTANAPAAAADSAVSLAPAVSSFSVGVRAASAQLAPMPAPLRLPRPGASSQNRALMIIGGAAFLAGAIIGGSGGTIIMIGGLGVGLYGLYNYLQ